MDSFGIEAPGPHTRTPLRPPARYLLLIDAGGSTLARLFTAAREPAGEFDASAEEVAVMTQGLQPATGASTPEWAAALEGHSPAERAAARVYTLDV